MNDDTLQDLKQFIATLVHQEVTDVRTDIKDLDSKLSTEMDELSAFVAEAIDNTNEATDTQLKDQEQRIVRLKQEAA